MGFGGTFISMALAEELIETSDQYTNIADALGLDAVEDDVTIDVIDNSQQILVMRESGITYVDSCRKTNQVNYSNKQGGTRWPIRLCLA